MSNTTAKGVLHAIGQTVQVSEKFQKREFVLEIPDGNYTQHVQFQVSQKNVSLLDDAKVGSEVEVTYNLQGKKYVKDGQTRYFNTLSVWKIDFKGAGGNTASTSGFQASSDADNDLPF